MERDGRPSDRTGLLVLSATILGSGMVFLDGTVVNLALPALQGDFHSGVSALQWVVEAYALTLAALLLVGGSLGDRYGRRKIYVYGIFLFALSSVVCGFAPNTTWLILARAAQGVGGALLVPGALALITATFPEEERGRAIGTWSGFSAVTTAIGPVAGGWLIERFGWRSVFFLNLPLALTVVAICLGVPEARDETATGDLDWLGALLTTAGLTGITFALIEWPAGQHSLVLLVMALGSVCAFVALGFVERRAAAPMLPFDLFRSRNFSAANGLTFLIYAPLGALLFFTPLDLIQVQHYSTPKAGAAFLPFVIIMLLLSRWAGRLVERYGARLPLSGGPLLTSFGFAFFTLAPQDGHYWRSFFPGVLLTSLGMAIAVAPLTTTVMNAVPLPHAGVASGINNAVSRLASLIAIAAYGVLLVAIFTSALDHRLASVSLPPGEAARVHAARLQLAAIKSANPQVNEAVMASFILGYRAVIGVGGLLLLLASAVGWFFIQDSAAKTKP